MTTPHPLRQCSAHYSFLLSQFLEKFSSNIEYCRTPFHQTQNSRHAVATAKAARRPGPHTNSVHPAPRLQKLFDGPYAALQHAVPAPLPCVDWQTGKVSTLRIKLCSNLTVPPAQPRARGHLHVVCFCEFPLPSAEVACSVHFAPSHTRESFPPSQLPGGLHAPTSSANSSPVKFSSSIEYCRIPFHQTQHSRHPVATAKAARRPGPHTNSVHPAPRLQKLFDGPYATLQHAVPAPLHCVDWQTGKVSTLRIKLCSNLTVPPACRLLL
jgi:hypothetical protein